MYNTIKHRTAALLLSLLLACSLDGCGFLPDFSWLPWHSSFDLETLRADADLPLYDLTSFIQREERTLCAASLLPDTDEEEGSPVSLLLVSRNVVDDYVVETLNLSSGEILRICVISPGRTSSAGQSSLKILNTSPLFLLDETAGVLYRQDIPADGSQASGPARIRALEDDEKDASFFCVEGELYASVTDGQIWHYDNRLQRSLYWTLPDDFTWLIPKASPEADKQRFLTYRIKDRQTACTLQLSFPGMGCSVSLSSRDELPAVAAAENLECVLTTGRRPAVGLYDTEQCTQKYLILPAALQEYPEEEHSGDDYLKPEVVDSGLSRKACLILEQDEEGTPHRLLLWLHEQTSSQSWTVPEDSPLENSGKIPQTADSANVPEIILERTRALEETWNIRILLGEDIPREGFDYRIETCTDEEALSEGLDILEEALSLYPDGFFASLKGDYYRGILFLLTGGLTPANISEYISNAGAFSTVDSGLGFIAMDVRQTPARQTLVHEITHLIDYRLLAEGMLDEEEWNAMNPEGFAYYGAYLNEDGESYETAGDGANTALSQGKSPDKLDYDSLYFIDTYSKTWPMEDRARLMEYLFLPEDTAGGSPPAWYAAPHLQEKAGRYFQLLRSVLGTEAWPEETTWEQKLRKAR